MAKSKLLTAVALTSAMVLVACGGNTQDEDTTATTVTEPTVVEAVDDMAMEVEEMDVDAMAEDAMDMASEYLNVTTVLFDFDQSSIRSDFTDILDAHAAFLVANSDQMVVLEGHADERGTREYNLGLGESRSKQVSTYLQIKGVSASQIDVVSYGEEKPASDDYADNRRVEIVYK